MNRPDPGFLADPRAAPHERERGVRPERVELWGGVECTVNRVGDAFHSQLDFSGHVRRPGDLDAIGSLGVRTLRYPVLWELTEREPGRFDWRFADERLPRLRALGIAPIAGLVHHGSGPRFTSLLDPAFATGLAAFARRVAQRYPWLDRYTPVNEPLTTARFSALYGLWHPHRRDDRSFVRALVHECRATVLAMRAIREVNPGARLVQTEDLGTIYATPALRYQADFENERRWLTWDLVGGRVDRGHAMRGYLVHHGAAEAELDWFVEHATPADVVGINHYVTSDRFLDERVALYPPERAGGNGRDRYADVEAVRALDLHDDGLDVVLRAAWARYRTPIAITEAHLGCSRDEQMRWLHQVCEVACDARDDGVPVQGVTAWALFGSYDWVSLLTEFRGHYEPGAFDVRGGVPRPTAIARLVRALAHGEAPRHAELVQAPGWWRRPTRFLPHVERDAAHDADERPAAHAYAALRPGTRRIARSRMPARPPRPILVTGARGTLAQAFGRLCEQRGLPYRLVGRDALDIADPAQVTRALGEIDPWAVVNAAGYVRVDDAEADHARCFRENSLGPAQLARACAERGVRLCTFSSDLVFDGERDLPYVESDTPRPLNVYGHSKARAETEVRERCPDALVVRTSAFFGPWDRYNFVTLALEALAARREFRAIDDAQVSPTYVPDLVQATLDLLIDHESGVWHLANRGEITWSAFAREAAARAGVPCDTLVPVAHHAMALAAARPRYSVLGSERAVLLPALDDALDRYVAATRR